MDEPAELALVASLEDAARALREGTADVRWLLELLAERMEALLPGHVDVERTGVVRRRVQSITIRIGGRQFVCRDADGSLATAIAEVRGGIAGRRRRVPPAAWAVSLQRALAAEVARADADRDALNRLVP